MTDYAYRKNEELRSKQKHIESLQSALDLAKEALIWIEESGRILRGNELQDEPYLMLVQDYKNHEKVAREALAAIEKILE